MGNKRCGYPLCTFENRQGRYRALECQGGWSNCKFQIFIMCNRYFGKFANFDWSNTFITHSFQSFINRCTYAGKAVDERPCTRRSTSQLQARNEGRIGRESYRLHCSRRHQIRRLWARLGFSHRSIYFKIHLVRYLSRECHHHQESQLLISHCTFRKVNSF